MAKKKEEAVKKVLTKPVERAPVEAEDCTTTRKFELPDGAVIDLGAVVGVGATHNGSFVVMLGGSSVSVKDEKGTIRASLLKEW